MELTDVRIGFLINNNKEKHANKTLKYSRKNRLTIEYNIYINFFMFENKETLELIIIYIL